ncbi:aldehyde dehydrogenase family protein [Mangrovihabitans endophyticus]|uniref:Aldehyde dehydrogenase n=1 Tax=Mangrovihabitans endophyticus TaxID=1751298 RepID=A0A8J3BVP9_9ACTN|nr:aldehyde dehydrogenase family protein [Mangrovihabitans endophyticus]GGK81605.1 aldehyde dehydrogenase [Mangrovihabitans endophyticus]
MLFIDGDWLDDGDERPVHDRWTGDRIGAVRLGTAEHAAQAVDAAAGALRTGLPVPERARVLAETAGLVTERAAEFAALVTAETGKPIAASRAELARAAQTLGFAAAEARRITGEGVALDAVPAGAGTIALTIPEPRGVVAAVTPFNFPVNLVLHKVAPAIAAGCPVVLKPSEKAVLPAAALVRAFTDAGLPPGWLNLVCGEPAEVVDAWLADDRVAVLNFTGSSRVGWQLKARSPRKLHILELGSATAMVVTDHADLDRAAADAVTAALGNSGQACVSLQRLYVTAGVHDAFVQRLTTAFREVRHGDPGDPGTVVGPMITESATAALAKTIADAVSAGATVLAGGEVVDGVLPPTLLAGVDPEAAVVCEEAFGPVLTVLPVADLEAAIAAVNASRYGLNTAVHTADLAEAMTFARRAQSGTVLVNMPPSFRADHMPYGGVKESGQGTEGVGYAVREMQHHKLVAFHG